MDSRARRLLDMLAAGRRSDAPLDTPAARRLALQNLAEMADDRGDEVGAISDLHLPTGGDGVGVRLYTPVDAGPDPLPALIFMHGGGWVAGGLDTSDGLCRRLTRGAGCRVIAVDYRLAPEHKFPAGLDDGLAVTAWVAANADSLGVDPDRLAVGGDSAGATLAAAICLAARDDGPKIAAQLLICPILDIGHERPSRIAYAEGYFVDRAAVGRDIADYCPADADRRDPRLSPLQAADVSRLPPTLIHIAEFDPFHDEGRDYAARLLDAGVAVELTRHDGMIHYFYAMARAIPKARAGAEVMGSGLRELLS